MDIFVDLSDRKRVAFVQLVDGVVKLLDMHTFIRLLNAIFLLHFCVVNQHLILKVGS